MVADELVALLELVVAFAVAVVPVAAAAMGVAELPVRDCTAVIV
jgi:hypothetical protein